jgi:hypothetical protein
MKNSILMMFLLSFGAVSASCSVSPNDGSGGAPAGGTTAEGGTVAGGGVTASGGQSETGGAAGTGGRTGSGGTTTTVGAGGAGGEAGQGGTTGAGGTTASGGESGTSATGGRPGRDAGSDTPRGTGGVGTGGKSETGGGGGSGGAGTGGTTGSGGTSAATPSAGCGKTPTLTSGSRTIQSNGQNRSYILRIPANYDKTHPYRLIFAFHWNGGTMNDIDGGGSSGAVWSYYGMQAQANNSTIFVAPQGNGNGWANSGGADLKFVDDMVALIEGDLCVDTTRIFSMGFSYGGGMSYAIACARAKVFRAVAVYSGAQLSGCDGGKDPIAYLGIHGISDGTCNIAGGRSLRDKFVQNNGCTAQSPPEPRSDNLTHTCTTYQGYRTGYPIE